MIREKLVSTSTSIYQFEWAHIQHIAALAKRTMDTSITITDKPLYVATKQGEGEVSVNYLQES